MPITDIEGKARALFDARSGIHSPSVAWLANALGDYGRTLEPGHVVLTGALHAAVPMHPGDAFRADFDRLGSASVQVSD